MLTPPQNLDALVEYLTANPNVMCRHPAEVGPHRRKFLGKAAAGLIWLCVKTEQHALTPFNCPTANLTITYRPDGFDVRAFGRTTKFDYLPNDEG